MDSLTYFSGGKISQGGKTTLDNYKKGYPTTADTGKLDFKISGIPTTNEEAYGVIGKYLSTRMIGDAHGTFCDYS